MQDCFVIDLLESRRFARLSGDFNPLHVDPVAARRTQFGGTAVHGVHLLLKSLDSLLSREPGAGIRTVGALKCTFSNPVPTGQQVSVEWNQAADGVWQCRASCGGRRAFVAGLSLQSDSVQASEFSGRGFEPVAPLITAFPPTVRTGSVPLSIDSQLLAELFPAVDRMVDRAAVADLLASTRVIGMHLPGLHSIYSAIKLSRAHPRAPTTDFSYSVRGTDGRFGGVELDVVGAAFQGTLECFYRSQPVRQAPFSQVRSLVQPAEFSEARVLVVGGSRGLGEVVTKLLVAGGAAVTFSYARGEQEAEQLVAECRTVGATIAAVRLDVLDRDPALLAALLGGHDFTHVYYFATPQIARRTKGGWHQPAFDILTAYYLDAFARIAERPELQRAVFCYPSTVYLERYEAGFAEYCAAKAAGECLCDVLTRERGIRVLMPRLERMRTDQTASVSGPTGSDPLTAMLPVVRLVQQRRSS